MGYLKTARRVSDKLGRIIYSRTTTFPYLSGDVFARKSDLVIPQEFSPSIGLRRRIYESRVIFCDGYQVGRFLEVFGREVFNKILVVGNSDSDWFDFPIQNAPRIKAVFLQNSFVEHERVFTLPIGVENISYFRNGRSRNFSKDLVNVEKINSVLVGPFSLTHEIRRDLCQNLLISNRVHVIDTEIFDSFSYAKYASKFGYIASPRGNGEDTHRSWESLYRGSSPVILRNSWSNSLLPLNLPIALIDEWSSDELDSLPTFQTFDPSKIEALWWPYWERRFSSLF